MARTLAFTILIALAAATASAQDARSGSTTRLIPYAATLPGDTQDGTASARAVTFALFDDAEGGTLLWTETQTISVDARGRFSAHLGASVALPLEIFRTEQARWLEITVDGRALPRTMLVAVPYALRAVDAETLAGRTLSEFVLTDANGRRVRADGTTVDDPTVDGTGVANQIAKWSTPTTLSSSIITESFDNRLGVLAPDPTGGGVVDSRLTIRNPNNNTAFAVLSPTNQRRFALNTLATGGFQLFDGGSGTWNAGAMQLDGRLYLGGALPSFAIPPRGTLVVAQIGTERNAIFARKLTSDFLSKAIQGRSGEGIFGPVVAGIAGVADSNDVGANAGVLGVNDNASGIGVVASAPQGVGLSAAGGTSAAQFIGNVTVTGTLTKGGGAFEIDHPLDPANKHLRHSFVESPDMMNVYNGNATLDANGEAWVTLPEWFEALNRDFRYQLTSIGRQASPFIAAELADNRFKIAGGAPNGKVSWQITGIRQDAWANANRIVVEEAKPASDRGFYRHPEAAGLSDDMTLPSVKALLPVRRPIEK